MDDHGGLGSWGIRNWSYAEPPLPKIDHNCHLTPNRGNFAADIVWEGWINHRDNKNNNTRTTKFPDVTYDLNFTGAHPSQFLRQPDPQPPQVYDFPITEEKKEAPLKKGSQERHCNLSKPKELVVPNNTIMARSVGLVVDGMDLDLDRIPTPVCSCTGELRQCYKWGVGGWQSACCTKNVSEYPLPAQCYKWGVGGWQSACCTKNVSEYPLPANMKRRGARITGQKTSLGAFKKVLEAVVREGHNLSNPVDLKPYWAKHGKNKFVTIR